MLSKVPRQLEYVQVVSELIVRAAKHFFTSYMQSFEIMGLSVATIAIFPNFFLGKNSSTVSDRKKDVLFLC